MSHIIGLLAGVAVAMGTTIWVLNDTTPGVVRSLLFFCLGGAGFTAVLLAVITFFSIGRNIDRG